MSLTTAAVRASNGTTVTPTFTAIASNSHVIALNSFTVAKAANGSKAITTSALRFDVTAVGKDKVTLNSLDFSNLLAGYATTSGQVKVYKTNTSVANLAGQTTAGTFNGTVNLSANNVVDAGTTTSYIVTIENIVGNAATQDWSVSLTNINFDGGLIATNFNNVGGGLAITESK
jgi:hypothetical protein